MKKIVFFILSCTIFLACKKETLTPKGTAFHLFELDNANDTLYSVYIPNTFTPDGDGINDVYKVEGYCNFNYLRIYSKYNNLIFETTNVKTGWDGKINAGGDMASVGSYGYVLSFFDKNKKEYVSNGGLHLSK